MLDRNAAKHNLEAAVQPQMWQAAASQLAAMLSSFPVTACPANASEGLSQLELACNAVLYDDASQSSMEILGSQFACSATLLKMYGSLELSTFQQQFTQEVPGFLQAVMEIQTTDTHEMELTTWPCVAVHEQIRQISTQQQQSSQGSVGKAIKLLQMASTRMAEAACSSPSKKQAACIQVDIALVAATSLLPVCTTAQTSSPASEQDQETSSMPGSSPEQLQQDVEAAASTTTMQSATALLEHAASLLRQLVAATHDALTTALRTHPSVADDKHLVPELLNLLHLDVTTYWVRGKIACAHDNQHARGHVQCT